LPALGTPLDVVWLGGSLGAFAQGSDRGIAHHWGPWPADCPAKQEGVAQESRRASLDNELAVPANQHPSSSLMAHPHPHRPSPIAHRTITLAQGRQSRTADSEMENVVLCRQIMGKFRWLAGACPSRARPLDRVRSSAEPLTGKLVQIHSAQSSNVQLASVWGDFRVAGTCHHSLLCSFLRHRVVARTFTSKMGRYWWAIPRSQSCHCFLRCFGSYLSSCTPGLLALEIVPRQGPRRLVSRGIGLCLLPEGRSV
jgi:hypothetical protein